MEYSVEKNEQYALVEIKETILSTDQAAVLSKLAAVLWREGYTNIILDLAMVQDIEADGMSVIRKANDLCTRDGGLLVLATTDEDLIEALDSAKINNLTILPTTEEAIDAVYLNDLENEFKEAEDDEYDYGMGNDEEEGSSKE